MQTLNTNPGG